MDDQGVPLRARRNRKKSAKTRRPQASRRSGPQGQPSSGPGTDGVRLDAPESRERILKAAVNEFAREGYGGARVERICAAARSNPRMLYHYFEDKAALYVAVLEQ